MGAITCSLVTSYYIFCKLDFVALSQEVSDETASNICYTKKGQFFTGSEKGTDSPKDAHPTNEQAVKPHCYAMYS
jgi:hypothetical protein